LPNHLLFHFGHLQFLILATPMSLADPRYQVPH